MEVRKDDHPPEDEEYECLSLSPLLLQIGGFPSPIGHYTPPPSSSPLAFPQICIANEGGGGGGRHWFCSSALPLPPIRSPSSFSLIISSHHSSPNSVRIHSSPPPTLIPTNLCAPLIAFNGDFEGGEKDEEVQLPNGFGGGGGGDR